MFGFIGWVLRLVVQRRTRWGGQPRISFVCAVQMDLPLPGPVSLLLRLSRQPHWRHAACSPHMQNRKTVALHVKVKADVRLWGEDFAGAGGGIRAMAHRCGEWPAAGRAGGHRGQASPGFCGAAGFPIRRREAPIFCYYSEPSQDFGDKLSDSSSTSLDALGQSWHPARVHAMHKEDSRGRPGLLPELIRLTVEVYITYRYLFLLSIF